MLTVLQQKLAEAHGLAIAAAAVTRKVEELVDDPELVQLLHALHRDAEETRSRCVLVEQDLGEELATELLQHVDVAVRDRVVRAGVDGGDHRMTALSSSCSCSRA